MKAGIVIVAGGSGSRISRPENKVFIPIGGQPMLAWSVAALAACPGVERLVVVCRPEDEPEVADVCSRWLIQLVTGGSTRHRSESNGIAALADADLDVIAVHDAARPMVTTKLATTVLSVAARVGGAIPSLPLGAPVFRGGSLLEASDHVRAQTPQAFRAVPLVNAYKAAAKEGFEGFDTAETVERFSTLDVAVISGDPDNLKITYPPDIEEAERIIARR